MNSATPGGQTEPRPLRLQHARKTLLNDSRAGIVLLESLVTDEPDWLPPLLLLMRAAIDADDEAAANSCILKAEQQWPDSAPGFLLRAQWLEHCGELDSALATAREGIGRLPGDGAAVAPLLTLIHALGGRRALGSTCLGEQVTSHMNWRQLLNAASIYRRFSQKGLAHQLEMAALAKNAAAEAHLPSKAGDPDFDLPEADWDSDLISIERPGSDFAVVVFTGLGHEVGLSVEDLYRQLVPLNAHFVALRDVSRQLHLSGNPDLGNTIEHSARLLDRHIRDTGAERVLVIGNSAGSLAALLYGALMGVSAIACYGAVTFMPAPFEDRGRGVWRRLERKLESVFPLHAKDALLRVARPIPVLLNYGQDMDIDRQYAEALIGIAGVQLRPVLGFDGHAVLKELVRRGTFLLELTRFLDRESAVPTPGAASA